jgi:parvulin-like peptidyl-prolyl isomerase
LKIAQLILILSLLLSGNTINGIAIKVNGLPITTFEIEMAEKELRLSKKDVVQILVQNLLEEYEISRLKIEISEEDIEYFVRSFMVQNRISSKEALFSALSYQGISKEDFFESAKKQISRPKLYQMIASAKISQPTEKDILNYFNENISKYRHAKEYNLTIYSSRDKNILESKSLNPLIYSQNISEDRKILKWQEANEAIQNILSDLKIGQFSQVVSNGNGYFLFYLNNKIGDEANFEDAKEEIRAEILMSQQKKIVENHFARLRAEAVIEYLR